MSIYKSHISGTIEGLQGVEHEREVKCSTNTRSRFCQSPSKQKCFAADTAYVNTVDIIAKFVLIGIKRNDTILKVHVGRG